MPVRKIMKAFLEHKKKLDDVEREGREATSEETYDKEFTKLRETSLSYKTDNVYPSTEGERSCNVSKNRYKDIVPFDHSRVRLASLKEGSSDYINASLIRGAVGDQLYIAAQGPMPKTVNDFWQMLWENDVRVMFMACREFEGEPPKLKCQRYWANSTTEGITFGEIKVTLEHEETTSYKEHLIRHLIATVGDESRQIVQLHYQEWPDRGVPRCIPGILDLIETLRKYQPLNANVTPPILVHCSAGCGRTGTILVIDYVQSLLKSGKLTEDFKLYDVIAEMRRQRMAIVQSLEQYVFVHEAIAELFKRQLELISKHPYENMELKKSQKPKIQKEVDMAYEVVPSTDSNKPKHVKHKPFPLPKPSDSTYSEAIAFQNRSPESATMSPVTPYASVFTPPPKEVEYAEPYFSAPIQKKPSVRISPKMKDEITAALMYGAVMKKGPNGDGKPLTKPNAVVDDKKSEYAYADPYQLDKWSLQAIARGKTEESAYASIDDTFEKAQMIDATYSEVGYGGPVMDDSSEPGAPRVPPKNYGPDEANGQSQQTTKDTILNLIFGTTLKQPPKLGAISEPYEIPVVTFRGVVISYPHRVAKPLGKRPVKMASMSAVH